MDNMIQQSNNSEGDIDISSNNSGIHGSFNQVHISEELKQFIIKIGTTKCEQCGLLKYIKDPYLRICPNIYLCDLRKSLNIRVQQQQHPYDDSKDYSKLIDTLNHNPNDDFILRTDISKILINYLGQCGSKIDPTRKIHFPIDHNVNRNVSYSVDTRIIYPNEDIKKLFKLSDTDELTNSNLQEYIKLHILD